MDYSLAIGIDNYLQIKKSTPFCENDAKDFHKIMKNIFNITHSEVILGKECTFVNINYYIEKIKNKIDSNDRLFLFYAGHGKNYFDIPYISCFDSNNYNITRSWINIVDLIQNINSSGCNKSLYFLDSCESALGLGSRIANLGEFSLEEKMKLKKEAEYTYVFSSTSHKDIADINEDEKHGIWSFYLLRALSGKESKALEGYNLTNSSLSLYLNKSVKDYCKNNKKSTVIQKSFVWGKCEHEFLIKEFTPTQIDVYTDIPKNKIKNIEFVTFRFKGVKSLSGFNKKVGHTIPKNYCNSTISFIQRIAQDELKEHIDEVSKSLIKLLGLKSTEFEIGVNEGCSWLRSNCLKYEYCIELDESDLSQVSFRASLTPLNIDKILSVSKDIDKCFPYWFDSLFFSLAKQIDIEEIIMNVEKSENIQNVFEYEFEPDKSSITLCDKKTVREITIKTKLIEINFKAKEEIPIMLDSLKELANHLALLSPDYKLLK